MSRFIKVIIVFLTFSWNFRVLAAVAPNGRDLRIAIIGAGASGLTAAYQLKKNGYQNITIYEKEDRIGGKIHTMTIDNAAIEVGAVWATEKYTTIQALAKEMGVDLVKFTTPKYILNGSDGKLTIERYLLKKYGAARAIKAYMNYKWVMWKFRAVDQPGFGHLNDTDLYLSFDLFSKKYGIEPLTAVLEPFLVACGYGYYGE
ncbi:MAG: FAD-dependent oxidoreductase, partial [Oligoflexales bacterium]|nr:FAD-dependent oxidoreductase [Oligoflexales bacterium]